MECFFLTQNGLAIRPNGNVLPCCRYKDDDNDHLIKNINNIKDLNDLKMNTVLEKAFSKDIWPSGCSRCKFDENLGIESRRNYYTNNKKYENKKIIDIAIGNFCNLKCVMCNYDFSTQWLDDQKMLIKNGLTYPNPNNIKNNIISKTSIDKIINFIRSDNKDIEIEIKGGEPLALPILEYLFIELAKLKNNVTINLITNGTFFPDWLPEASKKIKLNIMLSIEGTYEVYDYIRGTDRYNFNLFDSNVKKFSTLSYGFLIFNFVIQNLNIHNFIECVNYYKDFNVNPIFLKNPWWLQVQVMPNSAKDKILSDFEKLPKDYYKYDFIKNTLSVFQEETTPEIYHKFIKFSALLDKSRNKNLPSIAPHLFTAESLKEYNLIKNNHATI